LPPPDTDGRAGLHRLRAALLAGGSRAARARVRISEAVRDHHADQERIRLAKVAAQYLSETLPNAAAHPR
jgi:hypothetical protein